ncbi:MAG: hypothetical protein ACRC4N_11105 [Gammaproteobacteria bacterium]
MLGIVGKVEGRVEGKTPGMLGIEAMPGRVRGGRGARGGRPAEEKEQHGKIRSQEEENSVCVCVCVCWLI